MISENRIRDKVIDNLLELGWPRTSIAIEYNLDGKSRIDIAVMDVRTSQPKVVVEIKRRLDISDFQDNSRLRFNPSVRQLQKYAFAINADYYLLTDGEEFLWLETDSSGRPRQLRNPVKPAYHASDRPEKATSREEIIWLFRQLLDHFRNQSDWIVQDSQIALLLLAFFRDKLGNDNNLRLALEDSSITEANTYQRIQQFGLPSNEFAPSRERTKAFELLDQVSFEHVNPSDILLAIDDVFLQRIQSLYSISRWLADALVTFARINAQSILFDVSTNVGNILAAAALSTPSTQVLGMARNPRNAVWSKVQQVVVGNFNDEIEANDILTSSVRNSDQRKPTHVVTAPVMGGRIREFIPDSILFEMGVRQLEDLLLEAAINSVELGGRIVFLMPEGFLFGGGSRTKARELLLRETTLVAIISLGSGALKPSSSTKTSILILEKRKPNEDHQVFMTQVSNINEIPFPNSILSSTEIPEIARSLREYVHWEVEKTLPENPVSWLVPLSQIAVDNFSVSYYSPLSSSESIDQLKYPLMPIVELCHLVKRGRRIKLVEGSLQVIGPATIRAMRLDSQGLGNSSKDEIGANQLTVDVNDIVLNNIGTHLGSAAVVTEEFAHNYFSQHVMLLKPNLEQVDPVYLAAAINSKFVQEQIKRQATGSVMPSLTLKRLRSLMIPIPDIVTQRNIVATVTEAKQQVVLAETQLQRANALFESVLAQVGVGEL